MVQSFENAHLMCSRWLSANKILHDWHSTYYSYRHGHVAAQDYGEAGAYTPDNRHRYYFFIMSSTPFCP